MSNQHTALDRFTSVDHSSLRDAGRAIVIIDAEPFQRAADTVDMARIQRRFSQFSFREDVSRAIANVDFALDFEF